MISPIGFPDPLTIDVRTPNGNVSGTPSPSKSISALSMLTGPSTDVVPVKTLSDNVSSSFTISTSLSSAKSSFNGSTVTVTVVVETSPLASTIAYSKVSKPLKSGAGV